MRERSVQEEENGKGCMGVCVNTGFPFREDMEGKRKTKLEGSAWQDFRVCECRGERWSHLSLSRKGIQENILTSA